MSKKLDKACSDLDTFLATRAHDNVFAHDDASVWTAREYREARGCSSTRAHAHIREAIDAGEVEVAGKKRAFNSAGITRTDTAYRMVKGKK